MNKKLQEAPGLSLDAILLATVAYIDEFGLEKLTMRALASSMGVFPTALYWYVNSKARLIGLATSVVMGDVGSGTYEGTWEERLGHIAHETRSTLHEHPNFASVLASRIQVDATGYAAGVDSILSALDSAGFEGDDTVFAFNAFLGGITGWVCMELSAQPPEQMRDKEWPQAFSASLARQSTVEYPSLAKYVGRMSNRAFMTRWDSGTTKPMSDSFEFLLAAIISGLKAQLVTAKRGPADSTVEWSARA